MLAAHLALIGFEFKVHEPPELVDRIRSLAERLTRATAR
jgi:predicted DNA-binding transcriptional regulator YafY